MHVVLYSVMRQSPYQGEILSCVAQYDVIGVEEATVCFYRITIRVERLLQINA